MKTWSVFSARMDKENLVLEHNEFLLAIKKEKSQEISTYKYGLYTYYP